jgi:hypothetical protein
LAEAAGASEKQLLFTVARFGGASATRAAKLAGYAGTDVQLRRAGYDAVRSTAVQNLLELAAVNAPEDARISDKEIDARIAKLVRSADANVSLKAVEAHSKRQTARREREAEGEWNSPDAMIVMFLEFFGDAYGALVASVIGWHWDCGSGNRMFCVEPILEDLSPHVASAFPDVWRRLLSDTKDDWTRQSISELAARPLKPIPQIAAEARMRAGQPPTKANGSARSVPETEEAVSAAL